MLRAWVINCSDMFVFIDHVYRPPSTPTQPQAARPSPRLTTQLPICSSSIQLPSPVTAMSTPHPLNFVDSATKSETVVTGHSDGTICCWNMGPDGLAMASSFSPFPEPGLGVLSVHSLSEEKWIFVPSDPSTSGVHPRVFERESTGQWSLHSRLPLVQASQPCVSVYPSGNGSSLVAAATTRGMKILCETPKRSLSRDSGTGEAAKGKESDVGDGVGQWMVLAHLTSMQGVRWSSDECRAADFMSAGQLIIATRNQLYEFTPESEITHRHAPGGCADDTLLSHILRVCPVGGLPEFDPTFLYHLVTTGKMDVALAILRRLLETLECADPDSGSRFSRDLSLFGLESGGDARRDGDDAAVCGKLLSRLNDVVQSGGEDSFEARGALAGLGRSKCVLLTVWVEVLTQALDPNVAKAYDDSGLIFYILASVQKKSRERMELSRQKLARLGLVFSLFYFS